MPRGFKKPLSATDDIRTNSAIDEVLRCHSHGSSPRLDRLVSNKLGPSPASDFDGLDPIYIFTISVRISIAKQF